MSDSADPLLTRLAEQGVLSLDDISEVRAGPESDHETLDGEQLAGELVELSKLTPFQADLIRSGEMDELLIGNYVVLDLLGRGGMGHVYKARHRDMDRIVALKVLPRERVNSKSGLRRFQQEVKAAARLVHPNIVTAFDADVSGGEPYLVMEYVEGEDLQALLSHAGPLSFDEALDYVLQTARGLEYAHRVGVVHRDIKPANLLVDEHGVIRILDMGVAQLKEITSAGEDDAPQQITRDGAVIGTTDFMSPEQASTPREADARSDIYSLGCTLYFLLTDSPLFDDDSAVDRIIAHRQQAPPALRDKRPDLPRDLDTVFARMVAKDPRNRYQSVSRLIDDLELLRRGGHLNEPPRAVSRADEPKSDGDDLPRRPPLLTFVLLTVLVMVLAFSGFHYYDKYMPGTAFVKLHINQPDATVAVIDNVGRTTFHDVSADTLELDLPRGEYDLQVSKSGFLVAHRHVDLRPWETQKLMIDLVPKPQPPGSDGARNVINDLLSDPPEEPQDDPPPSSGDPPDEVGEGGAEIFKGPVRGSRN